MEPPGAGWRQARNEQVPAVSAVPEIFEQGPGKKAFLAGRDLISFERSTAWKKLRHEHKRSLYFLWKGPSEYPLGCKTGLRQRVNCLAAYSDRGERRVSARKWRAPRSRVVFHNLKLCEERRSGECRDEREEGSLSLFLSVLCVSFCTWGLHGGCLVP